MVAPEPLRPLVRRGLPALAAAFALAALFSTLLPLRQSAVGPERRTEELRSMRSLLDGDDVLFLGRDNFISWELLGSEVFTPIRNPYDTEPVWSLYRATPINAKFDWDNVPPALGGDRKALEDFDWVITTSAAFNSRAPREFAPALRTRDFVLWRRRPPPAARALRAAGVPAVAERRTLREPIYPGATVNCADPGVAGLPELEGTATVLPLAPVIGQAWEPGPDITDAAGAVDELRLRRGTWLLSLQYASTQELTVSAPRRRWTMPANLTFRGPAPYYPLGSYRVRRAVAEVPFEATVERPPPAGRLLGSESRAYLGGIAAVRAGPRPAVPLAEACGRYLDWYAAPAAGPAELAAIEGPTPQRPEEE